MNIEDYLSELKGQIRDKYAKKFVSDEIKTHIEEQADAFMNDGMSREDAISKAVEDMGDPVSVGVDLDRIHRPHLEWRFLVYVFFIAVSNIAVQYVINRNMSTKTDFGAFENLSRISIFYTIIGFAVMLVVYRLDYTILARRSRMIGAAYLIALTALSVFFGERINAVTAWISAGPLRVPVYAMMVLFLPVFAGILYDYRGKGKTVIVKLALWMLVPVFIQVHAGYISSPVALFILVAEALLFVIALSKDWYAVNKKAVIIGGAGLFVILISGVLIRIFSFNGYQAERLRNWLAHYGIGSYAADANSTINYVNSKLNEVFAKSNLIGGSDSAVEAMKEVPSYRSDLILGSVAANCGIIAMTGIILCLALLSVYMFRISMRQKNLLGCIVGCSCGVAVGLQSLSNVLIVFGILPLTDSILPFFATGISFTVVDYILLGLVLSIYRYKDIRMDKTVKQCMVTENLQ